MKRIQLTEGQLRNLITKAVLTETNWKTYMNAANKARDRVFELGDYDEHKREWVPYNEEDEDELYKNLNRMEEFFNASRKAYQEEYGSTSEDTYRTYNLGRKGFHPVSYEKTQTDPWYEDEDTDDEDIWYGVTKTQFYSPDQSDDLYDYYNYGVDSVYAEDYDSHVFNNPTRNPHYAGEDISDEELDTLPDEFKDVHHYDRDDWEWVKGKGWQLKQKNESLARRVTESIIRKLRRLS